ncbi:MAG TPA: sigma-70 family RNA polymerase sigma factor [Thermoanaerobaculia bacterium]|nr:sigma-70 family RNA polymerase sigma factor [Thermoanaerobaculia bacterium]
MSHDEQFAALYRKYRRRMITFFMRAFRVTEEDAEELTQDTFARFFEALDEYRGDAEWAYLEKIARNVGYNRVRAKTAAKRGSGLKAVEIDDPNQFKAEPAAPEGPDYAERQEQALRHKRLYDAIAALPPGQRQCLQLWLDGFQYNEIGPILRISQDAVKSRIRDAKRLLHARLGEEGTLPGGEE